MQQSFLRSAAIGFAGLLFLAGCGSPTGSAPSDTTNPQIPEPAQGAVFRPFDSLSIALQGVMDPGVSNVTIDEQGNIPLPNIGSIHAAGLGPSELQQRIADTYKEKKIYTTLSVAVGVTERYVYVGGEVMRPGRIPWSSDLTVAKAIQAAGGFSLYAKETAVTVVRDNVKYEIDVKLAQRQPEQDRRVFPGDSIQVQRSRL